MEDLKVGDKVKGVCSSKKYCYDCCLHKIDCSEVMNKIKDICDNRKGCPGCPLYKGTCLIIKGPLGWDTQLVSKALNFKKDLNNWAK